MATKVWRGTLQLGLLNIGVSLCVAARDKRIELNTFHTKCKGPVKAPKYCPGCETMLKTEDIFRGYKSGDSIVPLTDEEMEAITPETGRIVEIAECVKASEIDPSYLAESFYLIPDEASHKAYSLLAKTLADTGRVALAQLTKSSREHVILLRPKGNGLMLFYLWYADEIAKVPEFEDLEVAKLAPSELKLATQLLDSITTGFDPEAYSDSYRQRLNTLIASKMDSTIAAPVAIKSAPVTQTQDLMAALSASVANPPKRRIKVNEQPAPKAKAKKSRAA